MVKRKKSTEKTVKQPSNTEGVFMGLSRSQAQALGMGVILVGIGLFALAGYSYTQRDTLTRSILPDGVATTSTPTDIPTAIGKTGTPETLTTPESETFGSEKNEATPSGEVSPTQLAQGNITPTIMPTPTKEASTQAKMTQKLAVTKLPNTSSKVTYTVMRNDSLAKIGKQLCGTDNAWISLSRTNNLVYPYTIQPGQILIVTCY